MKRKLFALLALSILGAAGAFAAKGGPNVSGDWTGWGEAIYVDGTIADITVNSASIYQEGNLISGYLLFTVKIGDSYEETIPGQLSGYIQGNVLKGIFGGCITEAPDCFGGPLFEGKIAGNTLTGTVIDPSDGSTSAVTLYRIAD